MALSIIHFNAAGNAAAIFLHPLIALTHHGEDLIPLALEHSPHGVQPVRHAALVDDVQRARHVLAHALAFAQRRHTEFQQDHAIPFFNQLRLTFATWCRRGSYLLTRPPPAIICYPTRPPIASQSFPRDAPFPALPATLSGTAPCPTGGIRPTRRAAWCGASRRPARCSSPARAIDPASRRTRRTRCRGCAQDPPS